MSNKRRARQAVAYTPTVFTERGAADWVGPLVTEAGRFNAAQLAEARRTLAEVDVSLNASEEFRHHDWWQTARAQADRLTAALDARECELGLKP
ncbi:hypothetical protein [Tenggerimyces flavus]|uniref:Uncharacterized protein n=1 Tax=Tenggerimyces flavus TaxID=1708749 RepID=A0ABV7YKS9_9ACTN|nr:hypothetical protein [Tenggerimyces flavus]MBM7787781.1 hypothetical protein [Tenggerimyces flavus]